jgi:hypothetical protein
MKPEDFKITLGGKELKGFTQQHTIVQDSSNSAYIEFTMKNGSVVKGKLVLDKDNYERLLGSI